MAKKSGAVAAGHEATVNAASEILEAGGNAYDAVISAFFTACIAEPVLASIGGGGFLLAKPADHKAHLYDFFVQTPKQKKSPENVEFYSIQADFGTKRQEFHIGAGAVAVPGAVSGMFAIHRDLGSMPMRELMIPAIQLAKKGLPLTHFQAYIIQVIAPILQATDECRSMFSVNGNFPAKEHDSIDFSALADTLDAIAHEGEVLFYQGEIAKSLLSVCSHKGHLSEADLGQYTTIVRPPLTMPYMGRIIETNPLPSIGGSLIQYGLAEIEKLDDRTLQNAEAFLPALIKIMQASHATKNKLNLATRGTTHISIIDDKHNVASMTVSNGEGCGFLVPGCGFMPNNMLGEEDLNPGGFFQWQPDSRLSSMMAPSIVTSKDKLITLGSGGSNRIRTAMLQVLHHIIHDGLPLDIAIQQPRIHIETDHLDIEPGWTEQELAAMANACDNHTLWPELNLYFGGVHGVSTDGEHFNAYGDPRRGGAARILK